MFRRQSPGERDDAPLSGNAVAAARAFYQDALRGRQVWSSEHAGGSLLFLVGGALVEVNPNSRGAPTPILLAVDDPDQLAERCWDAGFSVRVHDQTRNRPRVSVVDPFGRQIGLVRRNHDELAARCG